MITRFDLSGQFFPTGHRPVTGSDFSLVGSPVDLPAGAYRWVSMPAYSEVGSCLIRVKGASTGLPLLRGSVLPLNGETEYELLGLYPSWGTLSLLFSDDPTASALPFAQPSPLGQLIGRSASFTVQPNGGQPGDAGQLYLDARDAAGNAWAYEIVATVAGYDSQRIRGRYGASGLFPFESTTSLGVGAIAPGAPAVGDQIASTVANGVLMILVRPPFGPPPALPTNIVVRLQDVRI